MEEQAVMRIHRIGQTNRVTIKRFIVKVHFLFDYAKKLNDTILLTSSKIFLVEM